MEIKLTTLPAKTILVHERSTLFPKGHTYPFFAYNWYSTLPFWSCADSVESKGNTARSKESIARYIYEVKEEIPNFILWENSFALARRFKEIWSGYVDDSEINDYALAAFACQVLGYSGLLSFKEDRVNVIISSHKTSKLEFKKLLTFNDPEIHPGYAVSDQPISGRKVSIL